MGWSGNCHCQKIQLGGSGSDSGEQRQWGWRRENRLESHLAELDDRVDREVGEREEGILRS